MHQNLKDNILIKIWKTTKTKVSVEKRQSGLPADKKLFTPGPLGCSLSTKEAMLRDLGSRDSEFIRVIFCPGSDSSPSSNESLLYSFLQTVAEIRSSLLEVAGVSSPEWSAVLLQVHNHSISQLISAKERQTDQSSKLSFPPAGPQPLYFSTYIGQRKTNRPKLKSFFFPGQRHVRC